MKIVVCQVWSPKPQNQHHMGTNQKSKFRGPAPDLLYQKLWGGAEESGFLTSLPGDSDACSILRTTGLRKIMLPQSQQGMTENLYSHIPRNQDSGI